MPAQEDFIEQAAPFRAELIAHCYRMLGSVHDAEDLVQETYLRGWRGYQAFEERAALRTWLYRIATTACLRALENRARRVLPAGLGEGSVDPDADLDGNGGGLSLARAAAGRADPRDRRHRPAQRAAGGGHRAAGAAGASTRRVDPARRGAVQRRRGGGTARNDAGRRQQRAAARAAHLADVAPDEEDVAEPDDADRRELLDRYCAAFENADLAALTELLQTDVRLEMPPLPVWFTGRDAVTRFLARARLRRPGRHGAGPDRRQRAGRRCGVPPGGRRGLTSAFDPCAGHW